MGSSIPFALYESLLSKLADVLELTQKSEGVTSAQARKAILDATNEFKSALSQAKEFATDIPGGELLISEQDEVIEMLTQIRDKKRAQLQEFASTSLQTTSDTAQMRMDTDSIASTPIA
ncbi:hypothetical protein FISHEDRAFT_49229 [Fistulina hepatica ATCC 64428]|uniref:Mediator complex subunit 9 n=1 Tax=Fistulina hepatica ATCC 64428 TaxID=1128425 RepID=A0A0D7A354_9AGAR|nr:hypothetical protein FISHEDRAFT_49229 [Fistulina hepatica ATCC 64428]